MQDMKYNWFRVRRKIHGILKKNDNVDANNEISLYEEFEKHIDAIYKIAEKLKPNTTEECFDRYYIEDYVKTNRKYIHGVVLEWAGGDICYSKKWGG